MEDAADQFGFNADFGKAGRILLNYHAKKKKVDVERKEIIVANEIRMN